MPTVLHFWSDLVATRLTRSSTILYDEEMGIMAHRLTTEQLDFVVMHELGHVMLGHPRRLKAESAPERDVTTIRHEFEFAANAFALGLMDDARINYVTATLHDYQRGLGGT